jgi:hypothetical protein
MTGGMEALRQNIENQLHAAVQRMQKLATETSAVSATFAGELLEGNTAFKDAMSQLVQQEIGKALAGGRQVNGNASPINANDRPTCVLRLPKGFFPENVGQSPRMRALHVNEALFKGLDLGLGCFTRPEAAAVWQMKLDPPPKSYDLFVVLMASHQQVEVLMRLKSQLQKFAPEAYVQYDRNPEERSVAREMGKRMAEFKKGKENPKDWKIVWVDKLKAKVYGPGQGNISVFVPAKDKGKEKVVVGPAVGQGGNENRRWADRLKGNGERGEGSKK